ncbi:MAG: hypothetical protein HMLIMOIP_000242 [Candidatus Nitrosomirales archaeon]|jgi:hypothetical protein
MTLQEIDPEIKNILLPSEEVLLVASQSRGVPGGSISTPNKIYVTNRRVIFKDPKWFGLKANIIDVSYKDVSNIRLKRGIFSTEIFLKSRFLSDQVKLPAVDKQIAQQVNAMIQQGIRGELPRQVISEDKNAPVLESKPKEDMSTLQEIEKLADMKQKGIITEDEFKRLKTELIKKLS